MAPDCPDAPPPPATRRELVKMALQVAAGIGAFVGVVALLGMLFREPLRKLGDEFVQRFGELGMAVGTFLCDGFHVPVPPQFYMFAAITGGGPQVPPMVAISIGSVLGGIAGYFTSRQLAKLSLVRRLLARSSARVERLFVRFGAWAAVLATILPLPYSTVCYVAGLYRMPARLFVLVLLLRIPRLVFFYFVIRAGWSL